MSPKLPKLPGLRWSMLATFAVVVASAAGCAEQQVEPATGPGGSPAAGHNERPDRRSDVRSAANASDRQGSSPSADVGSRDGAGRASSSSLIEEARANVRHGQYEAAIRKSKDALRRDEKDTQAMEVMARSYFALGKLEFAESICDIALGIDPASGYCHNLKGVIALRAEDPARALAEFKKATEVDGKYATAWLNLGAQYLEVKNYPESVTALERAVSLAPERPEVYVDLGAAYRGAGRLAKAEQALKRALDLKRNYAAAYFNLGVLYLDAESFPGMDRTAQLQQAIGYLNKYKGSEVHRNKDSVVDTYISTAEREIQREKRRLAREKRRQEREKAKAAKAAEAAKAAGSAPEGGTGATQGGQP